MHKQGIWPILVMLLVYLFLYMPILVVVVYSFNQNASNMTFQGFTLRWIPCAGMQRCSTGAICGEICFFH